MTRVETIRILRYLLTQDAAITEDELAAALELTPVNVYRRTRKMARDSFISKDFIYKKERAVQGYLRITLYGKNILAAYEETQRKRPSIPSTKKPKVATARKPMVNSVFNFGGKF